MLHIFLKSLPEASEKTNNSDGDSDLDGDDGDDGGEMSLKDKVSEKLLQLSVEFITQYFPDTEDKNSPLVHFASVLGII
jgi:hypothetical protein